MWVGDVNGLHLIIPEQRFVGSVATTGGQAEFRAEMFRRLAAAAAYGHEPAGGRVRQGTGERVGNAAAGEDTPAEWAGHPD